MQNINLEYSYMECVKLVKQKISFISEIGAYMICILNFQNVLYIFFFLLSFDTFCISTNNKKQTHLYSKVGFKFIFYYKIHIFYLLQSTIVNVIYVLQYYIESVSYFLKKSYANCQKDL